MMHYLYIDVGIETRNYKQKVNAIFNNYAKDDTTSEQHIETECVESSYMKISRTTKI